MGDLTLEQNCTQKLENEIELLFVPTMVLFQLLDFIGLGKAS